MLLALTLSGGLAAPARILDSRNWLALNVSHDREAGFGERVCYLVGGQEVFVEFNMVPEPLGQVIDFSGRKIGTIYVNRAASRPAVCGLHDPEAVGLWRHGEVYLARHPWLPHAATGVLPREVSARDG
jgi:hypothetical protein